MIFSETNSNFSKAFADAWGNVQTPKHNSKVSVKMKAGGSYTFEYTDMVGILDAVRDMFKEHGIGIMQNAYTELGERGNVACVETMLLHSSGEWVKSFPLKFPAANSMQDFGGQITYMKRYSLSALLGLSTDKDDDSNGYMGNEYKQQQKQNQTEGPRMISPAQIKAIGAKTTIIANKNNSKAEDEYSKAIEFCEIKANTSRKDLTVTEATKLIGYLATLEKQ